MTPDVVVDVGNSRIKWGRCAPGRIVAEASLPPDEPGAWLAQVAAWQLVPPVRWIVTGVHPPRCEALIEWLHTHAQTVVTITQAAQLPLRVLLEKPDYVGIDRLFSAVAARSRTPPGRPACVIDAGTAVTVDWLDADGAFRGGAIMPGLHLMAQALHDHTALLPFVRIQTAPPPMPAPDTRKAMEAGIFAAVAGGIEKLVRELTNNSDSAQIFLTGGDAGLLRPALACTAEVWPDMTLEGIRQAAELLP